MESNKFWVTLKDQLDGNGQRAMWQVFAVTVICPLVEAVLVNLWTGAPVGQGYIPGVSLVAVMLIHLPLASLIIAAERHSPEKALADAVEVMDDLASMRKELARRSDAYRMVVSAVEAFNSEVCRIDPYNPESLCKLTSFEDGIRPVIQAFIKDINTTLGVNSHQFSLEVYLTPAIQVSSRREEACRNCHGMSLEFYFSPHTDRCAPIRLTNNSPAHLGKAKQVATEQHIDSDRPLFYFNGKIKPELYFHRYAAIPINWPCADSSMMGILVLTSMQNDPFAEDALETMRFMASIISSYANRYSTCLTWQKIYSSYEASQ